MASGRKTSYLLIAVLLISAFGRAGFLYWDWSTTKQRSSELLDTALKSAAAEVLSGYYKNFAMATKIAANLDFEKAFAIRDEKAVATLLSSIIKESGSNCAATIILADDWAVFYSSDLADKPKLTLDPLDIPLLEKALDFQFPTGPQNPFPCGLCALSSPDKFTLSSFVPLQEKNKAIAVLAVSTTFGADLLKTMESKLKPFISPQNKLGLAFYVMQGTRITASSAELQKSKPAYLSRLTKVLIDPFEDKSAFSESDRRLWKNLPLWGPDGQHAMGQIIICATLANPAIADPPIIAAALLAFLLLLIARKK